MELHATSKAFHLHSGNNIRHYIAPAQQKCQLCERTSLFYACKNSKRIQHKPFDGINLYHNHSSSFYTKHVCDDNMCSKLKNVCHNKHEITHTQRILHSIRKFTTLGCTEDGFSASCKLNCVYVCACLSIVCTIFKKSAKVYNVFPIQRYRLLPDFF